MLDDTLSYDMLLKKVSELEMLNRELLKEKAQETLLDFAWAGNLGHWYWNIRTNDVTFNPLKITTLGYTLDEVPEQVSYQFFTDKLHPEDYARAMTVMRNHLQGKTSVYELEYRIQAKDGTYKWYYDRGKITQRDAQGRPLFAAGIVFDITDRKALEDHFKSTGQSMEFDELTGSLNRVGFRNHISHLLEANHRPCALVVLDIDRFKIFNDLYGYTQGDLFLKQMARTLASHITHEEAYGYVGGGKFTLLLEYEQAQATQSRVDHILEACSDFIATDHASHRLLLHAGIYVIEQGFSNVDILCDRASLAVATLKGNHAVPSVYYQDSMRDCLVAERELVSDLYSALENKEFVAYLQPKYYLRTGELSGVEVLVRWQHPVKGLIYPGDFITIFENNGSITKLDLYMFEEVCKLQASWAKAGFKAIPVAVNQSKRHLREAGYPEALGAIAQHYGVQPALIEIEFTETAIAENMGDAMDVIRKFRNLGFKISIDDFGAGYSSFNMLKDLVVDTLKIDREFLRETPDQIRSKRIISSIIRLAQDLDIETVAEGIETAEQAAFLRDAGCDKGQGFYLNKPMPVASFEQMLHPNRRNSSTLSLTNE